MALFMCTIRTDIMFDPEALRPLLTSIMTDWMISKNDQERNTMLNLARRGRILSFKCYMSITATCLLFIYFHLLKFRNMDQWILPYKFSYPYNTRKSPNYEITFFLQVSSAVCSTIINSSIDSFVSILMLHICAQLINLRTALNNLVDKLAKGSISSSRFKKELAAITMRHEHLIRYAKKFSSQII